MFSVTICVAVFLIAHQHVSASRENMIENQGFVPTSQLISFVLNNTDAKLRPDVDGPPLELTCGIYIQSFGSVDEIHMEFQLNLFLRQFWKDERMAFNKLYNSTDYLILNAPAMEKVWTPDLYFTGDKESHLHRVTTPNKIMHVKSDGSVSYSSRYSLVLSCHMELSFFPFDKQRCAISMESYGYNMKDMTLQWADNGKAVVVNQHLELPQFILASDIQTIESVNTYMFGDYQCLTAVLTLERQFGFYFLQTYVPSMLIVFLSWVSFWINRDAVPARITLSVTTVLTITTQSTGLNNSGVPKVSYPKALDIWLAVCTVFVFAAMMEYAFVNTLSRKQDDSENNINPRITNGESENHNKDRNNENQARATVSHNKDTSDRWGIVKDAVLGEEWKKKETPHLLDKVSRKLFPISFLAFVVIYWSFYFSQR